MRYLTEYYDIYNLPQKNSTVTDAEIGLIQSICPPPAKLLDIGCGTGRHVGPMLQAGYEAIGFDSNPEMLAKARRSLPDAQFHSIDISSDSIQVAIPFDIAISMWNAFNEYALSDEQALKALQNISNLLKSKGQLLLNIENASDLRPEQLNFKQVVEQDGKIFTHSSTLLSHDSEVNTTVSREELAVVSKGSLTKRYTGEVTQRWWSQDEVAQLAKQAGFSLVKNHQLSVNTELYLEFIKD